MAPRPWLSTTALLTSHRLALVPTPLLHSNVQCCCPRARSPSRRCTRSGTTRPRCCCAHPPPHEALTCRPLGMWQAAHAVWRGLDGCSPCSTSHAMIGRGLPACMLTPCGPCARHDTSTCPAAPTSLNIEGCHTLSLLFCSHVYNIEPPVNASEYLHRAGRSGRIGSTIEGGWVLGFCACFVQSRVGPWFCARLV